MSKKKTPEADVPESTTAEASSTGPEEEVSAPAEEQIPAGEQAEVLAARAEAEDYKDRWLRVAAEFDNYRRRVAREYREQMERASERVLRQLLEPVDNLERAIKAAKASGGPEGPSTDNHDALVQGVELIYQQCVALLEREQVRPMESVGKPFDPQMHDALMMIERDDFPANTVVEEVQRGYWLGERVLRHAKVIVSKAPAQAADATQEPQDDARDSDGQENS